MDSHDVYGGGEQPWEVFAMHTQRQDSKVVYLFTTTPQVHKENGSYISNEFGAWKVEDNGNSVLLEDPHHGNQAVGFKKTLYDNDYSPNPLPYNLLKYRRFGLRALRN